MDIHYDETSPTFLRWGQQAYSVRVTKSGKVHFGGWHKDLESALYKVREMRRELHGEFARD